MGRFCWHVLLGDWDEQHRPPANAGRGVGLCMSVDSEQIRVNAYAAQLFFVCVFFFPSHT